MTFVIQLGKLFRHFSYKQFGLKRNLKNKSKKELDSIRFNYLVVKHNHCCDYFIAAHCLYIIDRMDGA